LELHLFLYLDKLDLQQIVARTGLKTARAVRGAVEGAVGATLFRAYSLWFCSKNTS
jgi:hypothetical protein